MFAIMFLPRQFQVAVIENKDERHLNKAIWLFPLYMLAINVFVLPIAFGAAAASIENVEERKVIFASSLGTVFEWYDFYLYAVLAPFFAALFFPPGNQTAALLSAFAAYAAGFLVRPFGALLFGRIGDLVGRKYTFLVTIVVMGASTFLVGLLPTYAAIGWAPRS